MKKCRASCALWILLLVGIVARGYAVWALRHNLNLDAGVVTLMSRHIALGEGFPVFFYGQPHMGSLEAWCSALFCRLMGMHGFAVSLGTAFVAVWLLPIAYCWARDAAGKRAGLMALALLIIGPSGFYHYSATPRGAYAAALTFGALLVWYATRMAVRWVNTRTQSGWDFLLLGFVAGLAWWSNQITTAAILAAGLLLLGHLKLFLFTWRIVPGVAGFLFGSAPFWYYNIQNDWASFSFRGTFGRVPFFEAFGWMLMQRFPSLLFPAGQPLALRGVAAAIVLLLLLYGVVRICQQIWRQARTPATSLRISLQGIFLYVLLFSVLFASSHFAAIDTPRYTLPLVAPLAILLACAADQFARQYGAASAWVPVLFLAGMQYFPLQWVTRFEEQEARESAHVQSVRAELEAQGIRHLYAPLARRGWNFLMDENVLFCELRHNFYKPHEQLLELRDDAFFFENHGDPVRFVADTGGALQSMPLSGHSLYRAQDAPLLDRAVLPSARWARAETSEGKDVREALTDGILYTRAVWRPEMGRKSLQVTFRNPEDLCGFRFTAPDSYSYPRNLQVEGLRADGTWQTIRAAAPLTGFFWSGPRPYWGGPMYRVEIRFAPQELHAIRITTLDESEHTRWVMETLQFFVPAAKPQPAEAEAYPELLEWLEAQGILALYADRWLANRVHQDTNGHIMTSIDPGIFPQQARLPLSDMRLDTHTAIAILAENVSDFTSVVSGRVRLRSGVSIGPWVLYRPDAPLPDVSPALRWTGFGVLRDDALRALALANRARELLALDEPEAAIEALTEAIACNPTLYHERIQLQGLLTAQEHQDAARQVAAEVADLTPSASAAPIHFAHDIILSDLQLARSAADTLTLTYYWQAPPGLPHDQFAVFVHFLRDRQIVLQDDHVFLEDIPSDLLQLQQYPLQLALSRQVVLPSDWDGSNLQVVIGVYDRTTGERLKPRTALAHRRRAVRLPCEVP